MARSSIETKLYVESMAFVVVVRLSKITPFFLVCICLVTCPMPALLLSDDLPLIDIFSIQLTFTLLKESY